MKSSVCLKREFEKLNTRGDNKPISHLDNILVKYPLFVIMGLRGVPCEFLVDRKNLKTGKTVLNLCKSSADFLFPVIFPTFLLKLAATFFKGFLFNFPYSSVSVSRL